jgi:hypothetical protein
MSRKKKSFSSTKQLNELIALYFDQTDPQKENKEKPPEVEPPTLAGLAFFLGFNSKQEFEAYETKGRYAAALQRARLRIEAVFEKKLHGHSYGGAAFALKSMGRHEGSDNKTAQAHPTGNKLKIEIVRSGPKLAASEKEVIL